MHPYISGELERLKARWTELSFDVAHQRWYIPIWSLPAGWSRRDTPLWVPCPAAYPQMPPDNFYVDGSLRLADGRDPGNSSVVLLDGHLSARLFSYHLENGDWSPEQGDAFETFLFGIDKRLQELS